MSSNTEKEPRYSEAEDTFKPHLDEKTLEKLRKEANATRMPSDLVRKEQLASLLRAGVDFSK